MGDRQGAGGAGVSRRSAARRILAIVAAAALGAGLWTGPWTGAEARAPVRALDHHAAVLNGGIVGSAFLIAPEIALTNAHVVGGLPRGGVVTLVSPVRGISGQARVIAVSRVMDLALLSAPEGFATPVATSDAPARPGLAVRGAGIDASGGRGLGPIMELHGAVIAPRLDLGAYGPGLVVRMPGVRPGFSGGPVLDAQGRLVGMIAAIRSSGAATAAAGSFAPARAPAPDEAFVLVAAEIRAEARRLLATALD